jgi:hypothetical protein
MGEQAQKIDPEVVARDKERAAYRGKLHVAYNAFRGDKDGLELSDFSASILAVHMHHAVKNAEKLTQRECIAWAIALRNQNPVIWPAMRIGRLGQFIKMLRVSGMQPLTEGEYQEKAAIARGA